MVPKKQKLNTQEFKKVFNTGKNIKTRTFEVFFKKTSDISKVSFVVPQKIQKKAVKRNQTKRVLYGLVNTNNLPRNTHVVFLYKKSIAENKQKLKREITNILKSVSDRVETKG